MNHAIRLLPLLLCAAACRSTVDTSETLQQIVETRQTAALHLRERGEPRALLRIGQQSFASQSTIDSWYDVDYTTFGALPALAFDGEDILVMTGDVVVGGSRNEPEIVQVSRLWRQGEDGRDELVFETKAVILGSFAPLGDGHCLAIRYDASAAEGRRFGTALLRFSDDAIGNLPLSGFEQASQILIDPSDKTPVVLGQRRAGDGFEWGLFRLEGIERRAQLWEARVVAPSFSEHGRRMAYAWQSDREAARSGTRLEDGPHERLTVIDRETGAGRHLDTGLDVVATSFDPRDSFRLYALGLSLESGRTEWELLAIELEGHQLKVIARDPFPPHSSEPEWRKRLSE